jgi:hypothetical protein
MSLAGLRRCTITLTALSALLLAGAAQAQLAEWNEDLVLKASRDFTEAAGDVEQELRRSQVSYTIGSGQSKDFERLRDRVRVIRRGAGRLTRLLEKGKGRDETLPIYERMMVQVRDAQEIARRLNMGDPLLNAMGRAGDALRRLAPYYDPKANEKPDAEAQAG